MTRDHVPDVSIIVPHRDDLEGLARTLEAIGKLDTDSIAVEVIVADSFSDCGTRAVREVVARHASSGVSLVEVPTVGAGNARNAAALTARARSIAFIDCDCTPSRDWLVNGIAALARAPVVGGPVLVTWDDTALNPAVAFDLLFGFNVGRSFARYKHLLTSNLWVRAKTFVDIGGFRSDVSEDVEWCHRANGLGYELLYAPFLVVSHRALASESRLIARWRRITAETFVYRREIGCGGSAWLIYCAAVAASVVPHAGRVMTSARIKGAALRLLTLRILFRIRLDRALLGFRLLANRYG